MVPSKRGALFHISKYGMILGVVAIAIGVVSDPVQIFGVGTVIVCAVLYGINWILTQKYARTIRRYPHQ